MNYFHNLLYQFILFIYFKEINSVTHDKLTINLHISDASSPSQNIGKDWANNSTYQKLGAERKKRMPSDYSAFKKNGPKIMPVYSQKVTNKYRLGEESELTGWCLTSRGQDQNSGVRLLKNGSKDNCYRQCKTVPQATGCEWDKDGLCSYHTLDVVTGSGNIDHRCWIFYPSSKVEIGGEWIGDPNTFSHPDLVTIYNLHLDLDIDFSRKMLYGHVDLSIVKSTADIEVAVLDAKNLIIKNIQDLTSGDDLKYNYSYGKLEVPLSKGKVAQLRIYYSTSKKSTALHWLSPAQTGGKKYPLVFSQCEAIHCRSMLPCQDTPSVKFTYSANITASPEIVVLMSGIRQGNPEVLENGKVKFSYIQEVPIPSYLIALAAGAFVSQRIGPRSHVWSEIENIAKAAHDFSDAETMLSIAENLSGPYVWNLYDILVLPSIYAYGGMEHPCITFASLTLLSGDKANVHIIAHEIAHSWTGNLVTNINFEHFWINEGFTTFVEGKIIGQLYGEKAKHLRAFGGWRQLEKYIEKVGPNDKFTSLVVNLTNTHPDKVFSIVPYKKGSIFLWYLESLVGVHNMENFLRSYYKQFRYKSISSYVFKEYFLMYFSSNPSIKNIDWYTWLYGTGMPPYKPAYDTSLAQAPWDLASRWQKWNPQRKHIFDNAPQLKNLSTQQKVEFLRTLLFGERLNIKTLKNMEEMYHFNDHVNIQLYYRWIRLGLKSRWDEAARRALLLVTKIGSQSIIGKIYADLYDWENMRDLAIDTYKRNKNNMMAIARIRVEKELHLDH